MGFLDFMGAIVFDSMEESLMLEFLVLQFLMLGFLVLEFLMLEFLMLEFLVLEFLVVEFLVLEFLMLEVLVLEFLAFVPSSFEFFLDIWGLSLWRSIVVRNKGRHGTFVVHPAPR